MVTVWEEVFRIGEIGIDDDFFSLGGDSITGIRLVSRANKVGIKLETTHLFECYTVRQLFDKHSEYLTSSFEQHEPKSAVGALALAHMEKNWRERFPEVAEKETELGGEIEDVYHMTSVQEGKAVGLLL